MKGFVIQKTCTNYPCIRVRSFISLNPIILVNYLGIALVLLLNSIMHKTACMIFYENYIVERMKIILIS